MNLRDDLRELKAGPRELRKFGLTVGGVLAALALLFLFRHKVRAPYFLWPGIFLLVFGVVAPRLLKWIYLAWMTLAIVLGFVVSHVLLTLLFFLVITPVGLVARLSGKDFLSLKLDRAAKSYWIPRSRTPKRPEDYERQF
ncbi:MAG: hypothetical protein EPO07_07705 [Verrucomicrobia bacterium]|nr:MAG: hypothetical protein EPO07_07705 [Verrucomicrobiota bacterium]